jgi:putative transposase
VGRAKQKNPQGAFEFPNGWGGRRKGAGPKPKGERPGVSHRRREALASRFPVHVTLKVKAGLPSLRRRQAHAVLIGAFTAMSGRTNFRLVHYSVQSNHVHLICEALDRRELARGIQSLATRIAKRLNALWRRAGKLFADRYHDRILHTPREVRNALGYVLNNALHHGVPIPRGEPDPFSSAGWFSSWRGPSPITRAKTWLLSIGWARHGPLEIGVAL